MMQSRYLILLLLAGFIACSDAGNKSPQADAKAADSAAQCATPIMDPNNPKPMALMMRQMAANADSMKAQLMRGEKLDSLRYPFIRFYRAEPTDPKVLEPLFYENARLFQEAYQGLFKAPPAGQVTAYNAMIAKCVNCHMSYCNGPLKRINKLPITLP